MPEAHSGGVVVLHWTTSYIASIINYTKTFVIHVSKTSFLGHSLFYYYSAKTNRQRQNMADSYTQ